MQANSDDPKAQEQAHKCISGLHSAGRRPSFFKYYIHDGIESCRLQLIGELTETNLPELIGCWRTARTTLNKRTLVLDLQKLRKADDAGKQWLASMSQEGAIYLPENFLRSSIGDRSEERRTSSPGLFGKLIALFSGGLIKQEP